MAAGNVLQTPIQMAYREAFQNIVIPSFERSIQNMLAQVNETFTKGTRECEHRNQGVNLLNFGPKMGSI